MSAPSLPIGPCSRFRDTLKDTISQGTQSFVSTETLWLWVCTTYVPWIWALATTARVANNTNPEIANFIFVGVCYPKLLQLSLPRSRPGAFIRRRYCPIDWDFLRLSYSRMVSLRPMDRCAYLGQLDANQLPRCGSVRVAAAEGAQPTDRSLMTPYLSVFVHRRPGGVSTLR